MLGILKCLLQQRGCGNNSWSELCGSRAETGSQAFWDCLCAREILQTLVSGSLNGFFSFFPFLGIGVKSKWIDKNLASPRMMGNQDLLGSSVP